MILWVAFFSFFFFLPSFSRGSVTGLCDELCCVGGSHQMNNSDPSSYFTVAICIYKPQCKVRGWWWWGGEGE